MRFLPVCVCAALFALPAKADKFWLSDPAAQQNSVGSPEIIEGVLLAENDEGYHLRVVGGELLLPKKSVFKVEKDGLSLDAITKAERDGAERLASQNRDRELAQQAAAKGREIRVLEASARRDARAVEASGPARADGSGFDPVVGVNRGPVQADLMTDAQLAYEMTRDRRYLRVLRQLRRLR
ncbi:MAG: hypothetical protein MUC36_02340 [Planctomycetes bacterium]|jgi:hypothetical protein|nr:hypothetical protein [Planctomycetota bacterium]